MTILGGAVVEWQHTGLPFQRSPVQFLAGALEISEMLQVFPTQLEMYWYETQVILACIGAIH
ncbi:hypothetical protein DPMN_016281 [Dreissena polymorpha]|uniref:Uncharacterized protein n=1 Tax=Dreissena polymorpha TaxID=45954 RepID=A0A9D4S4G1_DREPO|nr:hypothetical protein DPMN_016281 [Dreissena polymorpha]